MQIPRDVDGAIALSDVLREEILSGQREPGSRFPSERDLQQIYGLARETVRRAVQALRSEGLVVAQQGQPSRVRPIYDRAPIDMAGVTRIETRTPTRPERLRHLIDEGVAVFVVWRAGGGKPELLPGDRWYIPPTPA